MISTDCGMGREGMSRRHAFYKIVSLVLGTNIGAQGTRHPRGRMPGRRRALFAGGADEVGSVWTRPGQARSAFYCLPKGQVGRAPCLPGAARLHTRRNAQPLFYPPSRAGNGLGGGLRRGG